LAQTKARETHLPGKWKMDKEKGRGRGRGKGRGRSESCPIDQRVLAKGKEDRSK